MRRNRESQITLDVSVEKILKYSGAALALIAALGIPAVTLQYVRLGVPLQLLTRSEVVRAGILPAIPLAAFLFLSYCATRMTRWGESGWVVYPMVTLPAVTGVAALPLAILTAALVMLPKRILAAPFLMRRRLPHAEFLRLMDQIDHLPRSWAEDAIFVILSLFAVLICILVLGDIRSALRRRLSFWLVCAFLAFWIPALALELSVKEMDPILAVLSIPGHSSWLGSVLPAAITLGFMAGCAPLLYADDYLEDAKLKYVVIVGLFCVYGAFATLYASYIYPRLPYEIYGGRPSRIAFWYDAKTVPESLGQMARLSLHQDGSLTRCDGAYLVYTDSEVFIITNSDQKVASSLVLRRNSISAFSTR